MKLRILLLTLLFSVALSSNTLANIVTLDTRTDVTQQILIEQPDNLKANLILFAGGKGKIKLDNGDYESNDNFLVRSRQLFLDKGFTTILIDAPSDRQDRTGMLKGFRNSQEHVKDIEVVIDYIRTINSKPIWLIGTSRGTESAAYAAVHLNNKINGVVLTSSISKTNKKGTSVTDLALDRITVPILAVHHKDDKCKTTKPKVVKAIKNKSYNSSSVRIKMFSGGDEPINKNPCKAKTYHGFLGIESEVVKSITEFINEN
ncbi:MAG TPA: alpha/beta hydrolase [Gammaproteobacteria bacterium]|nr:alpha/beta hydrolase [Gammaproteobacteria bacterium]